MTYTLGILLVWVFGLLAGAAAVLCAVLLMTLRIAHGGGSGGQKKLFGATLILLALAIFVSLTYATAYVRARAELDAEIALVRERGEPLWFSELEPEPVDPALDAGLLYEQALSALVETSMEFSELVGQEPHPELREHPEFTQALADNAEALELLGEALARPVLRRPRDYGTSDPINELFVDVQATRELARLLSAEAHQAIARKDDARALEAIEQMFALSELLRQEPSLIDLLVSIAFGGMALERVELLVIASNLTPDQFAALDAQLAATESSIRLSPSVIVERAIMIAMAEQLRSDQSIGLFGFARDFAEIIDNDASSAWPETTSVWSSLLYRPLLIRDEAFLLRMSRELIEGIDKPGPTASKFLDDFGDRYEAEFDDHTLSAMLFPAFGSSLTAALRYRQALTCARLGLHVDRYRAKHGRLPESLDAVLDEQLGKVPQDLFNDRPLVYEITEGGFSIHMDTSDATDFEREQARHSSFEVRYDSTEAE